MIEHVTLDVSDCAASRAFYERALAPLGWTEVAEWPGGCGFRGRGGPTLWLRQGASVSGPVHLAFRAPDRAAVRAFHEEALEAGGSDNGAPGLRDDHEHDYGACALDPDGNNVEAICHDEPPPEPLPEIADDDE